ncbi:MAG: hypothetical protein U0936_22820 [Planctomycetaceae bacterium]
MTPHDDAIPELGDPGAFTNQKSIAIDIKGPGQPQAGFPFPRGLADDETRKARTLAILHPRCRRCTSQCPLRIIAAPCSMEINPVAVAATGQLTPAVAPETAATWSRRTV